jgi:hypothetical protein
MLTKTGKKRLLVLQLLVVVLVNGDAHVQHRTNDEDTNSGK